MKTIFIFDDSRPTDVLRAVVALGEDGQRVARIMFDDYTYQHCRFAMCVEHSLCEDDTDISQPVLDTRAGVLRRFDQIFGAANWMPIWLDQPRANPDCAVALHRMRALDRPPVGTRPNAFGADALTGILGAIFGASETTPHTAH